MTFSKKRKRAARRMLNTIERKLEKIYRGWHFEQSEQELLFSRAWYEAQLVYGRNIFTSTWQEPLAHETALFI